MCDGGKARFPLTHSPDAGEIFVRKNYKNKLSTKFFYLISENALSVGHLPYQALVRGF